MKLLLLISIILFQGVALAGLNHPSAVISTRVDSKWGSFGGSPRIDTVTYSIFDPYRKRTVTGTSMTYAYQINGEVYRDPKPEFGRPVKPPLASAGTVVWTTAHYWQYSGYDRITVHLRFYDIALGAWVGTDYSTELSSVDVFCKEGIVAVQMFEGGIRPVRQVRLFAYDPTRRQFSGSEITLPRSSSFTSEISISNATCTWSTVDRKHIYGFTPKGWREGTSSPCAFVDVLPTTGKSPLRVQTFDLSYGANVFTTSFGNGVTSNSRNATATYTKKGSYALKYTAKNGTQTHSSSKTVTVK